MFYAKWRSKILENMACSKYQEKTIEYTKLATKSETIIYKLLVNIGVRAGGGQGGLQPPQNFAQLRFFGQQEKIWAKSVFKTSPCLFNYFEDLNINLMSA